jgi:sulfite reductase alpha subunit-like flavoprotein
VLTVDSGYWPLYRYKPSLVAEGSNPFILDSKKLRKDVTAFLQRESRFINLKKKDPTVATALWEHMNHDVSHRLDHLLQLASGYKAFDHPDNATVRVLYASETGTAARVANDFAAACKLSASASSMDDSELDDLDGHCTVFFIATCGQGAMPRNAQTFYKALKERTEPFQENTRFMIFGLGDSSYYFYCKAAKDVEAKLLELGAKKMLQMGCGDDSAEEGMEAGLHDWLDVVWPALELEPPKEVPHIEPVNVTFSDRAVIRGEEDYRSIRQFFQADDKHFEDVAIISNDLLCRPEYSRDFRNIRINQGHMNYELGDALEIFPSNDPEKVEHFLHEYSKDFGEMTVVKLHSFGINGEISLGALCTYVLDLFGKPSKHFMQQLATFETSEEERKILLDPEFLKKASRESGITVADVLLRFRKAQPPLPALLAMIPQLKPRAYSIASAPEASKGVIELCVLIDTWWCDAGMRYGLTCDMLRKLKGGDHLWCRVHPGSMEPPTPQNPVVCAGIGSGLAPHLAFLRDHVRAAEAGEKVAPFSLFFGNRFIADEFLYQKELEAYAQKYQWFRLHAVFSRDDPKKKVYVQDAVGMTDDARLLLRDDPNGLLYVCGNRQLPKPLQEALVKSFSNDSKDAAEIEAASKVMEDLYITGRAQQEVW